MRKRILIVGIGTIAATSLSAPPAAAHHFEDLPHGICITYTVNLVTPPQTFEVCVPLPPIP